MVNSISAEIIARRATKAAAGAVPEAAFLVFDTESVPNGRLIQRIKYPTEDLTPEEAVERAQAEAREQSKDGSDFLPVAFQVPVAGCVLRVGSDFSIQSLACLDSPSYRTDVITRQFWAGVARYNRARLVTFNGRGFDLPLMELAAFDYGCPARDYFYNSRNRFQGNHIDLLDWLSNYGACRLAGGLDLLAQLLGKPGKMEVAGDQVYRMHQAGQRQEINEYCMFDTLDTYFVFLRSRILSGDLTLEQEAELVKKARLWLQGKVAQVPALRQYLDNWAEWQPWP